MSKEHCSQTEFYQNHMSHDNERRMRWVVWLTCVMMVVEVVGGLYFGSMALLADGLHMITHAGALGISVFAYGYARRHMHDPRYSFGTGKVGDLAGFTSALILVVIAFYVIFESGSRLLHPVPIVYGEAILIAVVGLLVNGASALILKGPGHHHHYHEHEGHGHGAHTHAHHQDTNFKSAYLHVLADAVISLLAIFALVCGWVWGWRWLDPIVGMVGAFVILSWSRSLIRDTSAVLLDHMPQTNMSEQIRTILKGQGADITDLHLWRVAPGSHVAILAITAAQPTTPQQVREWLKPLGLAHMTVEINLNT